MSKILRILHLASTKRWTGLAEPMINMAFYQKGMGHDVWVGCSPGRSLERLTRLRGLSFLSGFHLNSRLNPFEIVPDIRTLRNWIEKLQPDVIHTHLHHDHWLAYLSIRPMLHKPLLIRSLHRFKSPYTDPFHKWFFTHATDGFIVPTHAMGRLFTSSYPQLKDKVFTVYGGVNQERFHPGVKGRNIRLKYGIPLDAPVAGIVSRLRKDRGMEWLLAALPRVLAKAPCSRFMFVGKGEMMWEIESRIMDASYDGRVIMAGYHSLDLPEIYAAMDVSVFPALGSEGSCRAILEAMNVGKPVIGVDLSPVAEIIEEGKTGFLAPGNDKNLLAQRLSQVLSDIPRTRIMGDRARKRMEEKYTLWRNILKLVSIYHLFLNKKS